MHFRGISCDNQGYVPCICETLWVSGLYTATIGMPWWSPFARSKSMMKMALPRTEEHRWTRRTGLNLPSDSHPDQLDAYSKPIGRPPFSSSASTAASATVDWLHGLVASRVGPALKTKVSTKKHVWSLKESLVQDVLDACVLQRGRWGGGNSIAQLNCPAAKQSSLNRNYVG